MSDSEDNLLYGNAADLTTYSTFPDETEFSASLRSDDHLDEYIPERRRKVGLVMILMCHLFTYTTSIACIGWLPYVIAVPSDLEFLVPLVQIMFYITGWIAGVITDSCLHKKPALLFSVVFSSLGASCCILIIYITNAKLFPSHVHGGPPVVFQLMSGYNYLYLALLLAIASLATFCNVLLPTIGGDQIPTRQGVRTFYTWFYLTSKIAELLTYGYVWLAFRGATTEPKQHVLIRLRVTGFCLCGVSVLATVFASIAALPRFSRSVNPDVSVITDGCGIMCQAIKRRRFRPEDSSPLSGAARSNGGDYPDQSVKERVKMIKFAVTCLLLLPVALSVAPAAYVDYNPSKEHRNGTDGNPQQWFNRQVVFDATQTATTTLGILAIYITCHVENRRWFRRPTLFSRFIAGHVVMIVSSATTLFGYYFEVRSSYYKMLPYVLTGLTNSLIYTTGYELTFISSPRSMQGTAMGVFYLIPGVAYSLNLLFINILPLTAGVAKVWDWITGIAGNLLGMLLLVVVHHKFDLGLSRP